MLRTREGTPATMLSAHPAAEIFPLLTGEERDALIADIRARGLRDPITLHPDGRILDGRNRYDACLETGTPVRWETWDGEPGEEVAWVMSKNLVRRHLNESQRALVASRLRIVEAALLASSADLRSAGKSSERVARALNVSPRSVESAAKVLRDGVPDLVAAVERGDASVDAASQVATLPPEEQARVVDLGDEEILRRAKEIRERRKRSSQGALHSSESDDWYTPAWVIEIARKTLGGIDLDPASCPEANEVVGAERFYTEEDDALSTTVEWSGRVWLNPPYGKTDEGESNQGLWTTRLRVEHTRGNVSAAVLLVNATPDRTWFHALWSYPIAFLYERVRFVRPGGEAGPQPTHPSVLVYFGEDVGAFLDAVGDRGRVVIPASAGLVSFAASVSDYEAARARKKRGR